MGGSEAGVVTGGEFIAEDERALAPDREAGLDDVALAPVWMSRDWAAGAASTRVWPVWPVTADMAALQAFRSSSVMSSHGGRDVGWAARWAS